MAAELNRCPASQNYLTAKKIEVVRLVEVREEREVEVVGGRVPDREPHAGETCAVSAGPTVQAGPT